MKKILLFLILGLCINRSYAQWPQLVHDPVSYATLGEVLIEAQDQAMKIEKQLTFAEKAAKRVEQVNKVVKNLKIAEETLSRGVNMIERINRIYTTISKMDGFSAKYVAMVSRQCVGATKQIVSNLKFVEQVLGAGLNMSDNERITTMQANLDAINQVTMSVQRLEAQTQRLYKTKRLFKQF